MPARRAAFATAVALAAVVGLVGSAWADRDSGPPDPRRKHSGALKVRLGGYIQPQIRLRQNSPAPFDEDGFRLRRARLTASASRDFPGLELHVKMEAELTPEFQLMDAYAGARGDLVAGGAWQVDFGQVKAPFSRQTLLSDAVLQLPEKAQLTSLASDRQLGARFIVNLPAVPQVEISGGMFNGEGRNQIENIDQKFLYVGRLAFRPIGWDAPMIESGFGPDQLSFAVSAGRNVSDLGSYDQTITLLGADAFFSMYGVSGTVEYLWRKTDISSDVSPDFESQGLNVQAGYLLPIPGFERMLEVAGRYEEFDLRYPNADFPILGPGDETRPPAASSARLATTTGSMTSKRSSRWPRTSRSKSSTAAAVTRRIATTPCCCR